MTGKLTVGMAVYDDFHGAYFTAQALLLNDSDLVGEVVVVDNNPKSVHGQATHQWAAGAGPQVRYVPFETTKGTAAPRDHVFKVAAFDRVVVCDPHVLFPPGSLAVLSSYYDANPESDDLIQGPMLYDDRKNLSTHFDLSKWDGEMWGQWATDNKAMATGRPFDIPAQGLGTFSCRKSAWLGFNPKFRGFGGEEGYIHEKYRLAGRRCLCLPEFKWLHRFHRPDRVPYPLSREDKVRNTVIGLSELGLDLAPHKDYWVGKGLTSEKAWDSLAKTGELEPGVPLADGGSCGGCNKKGGRPQPPADVKGLDKLFDWVKGSPRDLDQHADRIRKYAADANKVVAFVKRREWNVLLASGRPEDLTVYQTEGDPLLDRVHAAVLKENEGSDKADKYTTVSGPGADSIMVEPTDCDLLVIDTIHHADRLMAELGKHGPMVKGRILLRGTGAFGEQAEGGGPGLMAAVRRWVKDNPEWTVIDHTTDQYGLTVLSNLKDDKKPLPSTWKKALNAVKASWRAKENVVGTYGELKDTPAQETRLALCLICDQHTDGACAACGCPVDNKTSRPEQFCPLGKWQAEEVK